MSIDYDTIKNWSFPDVVQTYTEKDSILYALGVGYGYDPTDEAQLRFVYEKDLLAAPTMPVLLASPGFWTKDPATGFDWVKVLHGAETLHLHRPIPAAGTVTSRARVKAVIDKGRDKGAVVIVERSIIDQSSGTLLATLDHTTFHRGDGGFGQGDEPPPSPPSVPADAPDASCDLPTLLQGALMYRLCGDPNPVHAEPAVARAAGFPRPILHGLCTYGVAGHAILRTFCGYRPENLRSLSVRLVAPVYPGETIRTEMWRRDGTILFRSWAVERNIVVLNNGVATIHS